MRTVFRNLLLALGSGVLLAASFPLSTPRISLPWLGELGLGVYAIPALPLQGGYLHFGWLAFAALLPLLALAQRSSPRASFGWGYFAGFVWLVLSWCWLGSFGLLPVLLLAGFFALPLGAFNWLAQWLLLKRQPAWVLLGLPASWTALEYLRSFGFWAFPWNLLGYSQTGNLPLLQLAELGGVFAVSFVLVLANASLLLLLVPLEARQRQRARPLTDRGEDWQAAEQLPDYVFGRQRKRQLGLAVCGLGLVSLVHAYGSLRLWQLDQALDLQQPKLKTALVQGGINTKERWSPELFTRSLQAYTLPSGDALQHWISNHPPQPASEHDYLALVGPAPPEGWQAAMTAFSASPENPACLVVWPESCLPRQLDMPLISYIPAEVKALLSGRENAALLFGALGRPHSMEKLENGAVLMSQAGYAVQAEWVYSKLRPVPFGELLPFRGAIRFLEYPWSSQDITEGRSAQPFSYAGQRLAVQICFDNVWGFVSRRAALDGAQALLLVTNNSWYDLPSGIRQHCDMDVLRAIETRRALGRASTTGWSHIILPSGRTQASSPGLNVQAVVADWLPLRSELSAYCLSGDLFAQLCLLASLLLGLRVLLPGQNEGML